MAEKHNKQIFFKLIKDKTSTFKCYNQSLVYEIKNANNQKIWYCLQQDFDDINLYRCSYPPYYEPQSKCKLKPGHNLKFEIPEGDTQYINKVKHWINENTEEGSL